VPSKCRFGRAFERGPARFCFTSLGFCFLGLGPSINRTRTERRCSESGMFCVGIGTFATCGLGTGGVPTRSETSISTNFRPGRNSFPMVFVGLLLVSLFVGCLLVLVVLVLQWWLPGPLQVPYELSPLLFSTNRMSMITKYCSG
jgi:hypothetical protein